MAYVLAPTHAINSVVSIVAFAMLVFALVATYEVQAHEAGVLGVIALGAAILGTVFMAGDWWFEAFAVPRLAEVDPAPPRQPDRSPCGREAQSVAGSRVVVASISALVVTVTVLSSMFLDESPPAPAGVPLSGDAYGPNPTFRCLRCRRPNW